MAINVTLIPLHGAMPVIFQVIERALDGRSPMSQVNFLKWKCRTSLSFISSMSHVEITMYHIATFLPPMSQVT